MKEKTNSAYLILFIDLFIVDFYYFCQQLEQKITKT